MQILLTKKEYDDLTEEVAALKRLSGAFADFLETIVVHATTSDDTAKAALDDIRTAVGAYRSKYPKP